VWSLFHPFNGELVCNTQIDIHWWAGDIRICHAGGVQIELLDELIHWIADEFGIVIGTVLLSLVVERHFSQREMIQQNGTRRPSAASARYGERVH